MLLSPFIKIQLPQELRNIHPNCCTQRYEQVITDVLFQSMLISGFFQLIGSPHNPLLDFSGTILEHRSLDFFLHEAAPALSGYFDVDFWGILLPRVGYFEPPVQHAMIALRSLYEYSKCKDGYPNLMQQRYALIQYNKAIRALKSYNMEDPKTLEITMLTCLLFVCLELLRGNPEQALNHLDNGLSILRNSQRARERTSSLNQQHKQASITLLDLTNQSFCVGS